MSRHFCCALSDQFGDEVCSRQASHVTERKYIYTNAVYQVIQFTRVNCKYSMLMQDVA